MLTELAEYEQRGLVGHERHAALPLSVWFTTDHCDVWDEVTRAAQGLVVHDDGRIVGRCWPRRFALHDPRGIVPQKRSRHTVYDLYDGVNVMVTTFDGETLLWTRRSFDVPMPERVWQELSGWVPAPSETAVFTAVFESTRNVVDYGEFSGLILLGAIDHETGKDWTHPGDVAEDTGWSGEIAVERNTHVQWLSTMAADPENGENRKGFEIVWPQEDGPALRAEVLFEWFLRASEALGEPVGGLSASH